MQYKTYMRLLVSPFHFTNSLLTIRLQCMGNKIDEFTIDGEYWFSGAYQSLLPFLTNEMFTYHYESKYIILKTSIGHSLHSLHEWNSFIEKCSGDGKLGVNKSK